jgi:hypothetical protein
MGNNNHVVSHNFSGFQGHVGRHVVMMKEPVVVAPKFWSLLLSFTEAVTTITVWELSMCVPAKRNAQCSCLLTASYLTWKILCLLYFIWLCCNLILLVNTD